MGYPPAAADFKGYFAREFAYGSGLDTVQDADITRALAEAGVNFNQSLFSVTEASAAYLYAAAHHLVLNLQLAGGLAPQNGQSPAAAAGDAAAGLITGSTVGQISLSYELTQRFLQSPVLSGYLQTNFGKRYLQLLAPRLTGNMAVVAGAGTCGGMGPV